MHADIVTLFSIPLCPSSYFSESKKNKLYYCKNSLYFNNDNVVCCRPEPLFILYNMGKRLKRTQVMPTIIVLPRAFI